MQLEFLFDEVKRLVETLKAFFSENIKSFMRQETDVANRNRYLKIA